VKRDMSLERAVEIGLAVRNYADPTVGEQAALRLAETMKAVAEGLLRLDRVNAETWKALQGIATAAAVNIKGPGSE
jgi:hypothetical protein